MSYRQTFNDTINNILDTITTSSTTDLSIQLDTSLTKLDKLNETTKEHFSNYSTCYYMEMDTMMEIEINEIKKAINKIKEDKMIIDWLCSEKNNKIRNMKLNLMIYMNRDFTNIKVKKSQATIYGFFDPAKKNDLCYCGSGKKYKYCCLNDSMII